MMHLGKFEVLLYHSRFLRPYWSNHATRRSLRHKKIITIRYFIFFLNFDLDKGGASAPLTPPWLRPWSWVPKHSIYFYFFGAVRVEKTLI